jgi:5-methylcytosine-specific restriction endonuclease McrA
VRTHQRGWKKRNPDKVREQERKDKARAYKRHGEKLRAQTRAYGAANRDKIRARYTSERGRMLRRLSQQRRIARITAAPCDLTVEKVERLVARFGGLCCYCGAPWSELDHLVPVARGGGLVVGNIVPACKPCNVAKNARALEEFLSRARDRSRGRQGPGT